MAWNGSGTFSRTNGTHTGSTTWVQDRDAGTEILATRHDTHDQDLADGINACLTKNGETKPTADFKPNADNTYDLGSTLLRWAEVHSLKFQVDANFAAYLASSNPRIDLDTGNDALIYNRTSNILEGYIGGVQKWIDSGSGRFTVDGTNAAPSWTFISDIDSGFYRIGANNIGLTLGGTKAFDFLTTGLVVTGTASSVPMAAFSATPVTMTAGYTNNTIEVSKDSHGVVWIKGQGNKDVAATGNLTYFTLGAGYRPDQVILRSVWNVTDLAILCTVNTDGTVVVTHTSSNSSNTHFDMAFPTT